MKTKQSKPVEAWHFLQENRRLQFAPHTIVAPGKTLSAKGKLVMCENGMHASKRIRDALMFAPGPIVCRVELSGEILHDSDKSCARNRRVLWMLDATNILHEFACRCATDALALVETPDPRSVAAVAAKRAWLRDEIDDAELAAARAAAWAATRDAARAAARGATRAAARAAARDATRGAHNRRLAAMVCAAHRLEG